jgi:CDP-diacylglycerol---glycerol-3-phosphate 3-phosphatidyltransferase
VRERLILLAPALIPVAAGLIAFVVYCGLCLIGRRPYTGETRKHSRFFYFFIDYFIWMLRPVERLVLATHVSPNAITYASLVCCAIAGLAIGTGHLATAGWMYIIAGGLDVLDGRLARATGQQTKAGAFLDSVTDRWCELFVFAGFAWFLRDSAWLLVTMLALSGSMMVSYTRARGESLGVLLDGGAMQRAERIALVAVGTLVTAWFHAAADTREIAPHVIGVALLITGVGSTATAVSRWTSGFRLLRDAGRRRPANTTGKHPSVGRPAGRHA